MQTGLRLTPRLSRAFGHFMVILLLAGPFAPAVAQAEAVKLIDYGIYAHSTTRTEAAPNHISKQRNIVDNIQLKQKTNKILAQTGLSFGVRYRLVDPALYGKTLTKRVVFPPMTNPKTGETATNISDTTTISSNAEQYDGYGFDHGWEMVEGTWRFQLLDGKRVIFEQKFEVVVAIN